MVWSKSGNKVNKIKDAAKPMFEELTRVSRTLGELKCPELGEYPNAVKELSLRVEQFADAVTNPTGGMLDWRSNTLAKSSAFKESAARFLQSCPAANFLRSHFDGFNSLVSKVKLFRNPERTKRALEKNQALIKA